MARSCLAGVLLATMLSHCAAFLPTGFNPSLALRASKAASVCTMVRTKFLYQDPGINCTDISTRSPHAFAASWEPSGNFVEKGCSRCHDFDIGRCRGFGAFSRLRRTVIQQHDQCRSQVLLHLRGSRGSVECTVFFLVANLQRCSLCSYSARIKSGIRYVGTLF